MGKNLTMMVFEGVFSCCDRRHEGQTYCDKEHLIPSILGLYYLVLRHRYQPEFKRIFEFVQANKDRLYPSSFPFALPDGNTEERELFGELIPAMEKYCSNEKSEPKAIKIRHPDFFLFLPANLSLFSINQTQTKTIKSNSFIAKSNYHPSK